MAAWVWLIIAGAALGAPLFEELLFRAHIQTTIRRWGLWLAGQYPREASIAPGGFSPVVAATARPFDPAAVSQAPTTFVPPDVPSPIAELSGSPGSLPPPVPYLRAPVPADGDARLPAWPSWMAILLTSLLFATVHPLWTQPLIFVLALCLGYAYERTNNLWVTITMHALFNGVSTALFLAGVTNG